MRANEIRIRKRRILRMPTPSPGARPEFKPSGGVAPGELESEY